MRFLAVSDAVSPALTEYFDRGRWDAERIELVISCGDLPADYLSHLADIFNVPLLYVRGNHDGAYADSPPEGGEDIDGRIVKYGDCDILGLEGSPWYNGGPAQYKDGQIDLKLLTLKPRLWLNGKPDIIVTHAAPQFCPLANAECQQPAGVGRSCVLPEQSGRQVCAEATDRTHRGFAGYRKLIQECQPLVFLHGHRHRDYGMGRRTMLIGATKVIDAHGYYIGDTDQLRAEREHALSGDAG